jgi:hypothetical protein
MADEKGKDTPVKAAEPVTEDRFKLTHKGFGKYEVDGKQFANKSDAEQYVAASKAKQNLDAEIGDVIPEGVDMKIYEHVYQYRGSLMDLAMNEVYAPDGSFNPYYDRGWVWAWAAHNGTDISDKRAKGYQLVTLDQLNEGIDNGVYPQHLLSMVREEGSYLVYGDSVLMRMPRALWRQRKEEQTKRTLAFIKAQDAKHEAQFERAGVGANERRTNELQIRM